MATKHRLRLGEAEIDVEIEERQDHLVARIDDVRRELRLERIGDSAEYSLIVDGRPYQLFAEESPHGFEIIVNGHAYSVSTRRVVRPAAAMSDVSMTPAQSDEEWVQISPMAGVVQKVFVAPNDHIEAGDPLVVIEAMKMQNELHAHRGGQIKAVYVTVGQHVEPGTPLIVLL
jgi:glutaconyl-CoA/methylmalonyl-CoA decarboxylase subunit gamma